MDRPQVRFAALEGDWSKWLETSMSMPLAWISGIVCLVELENERWGLRNLRMAELVEMLYIVYCEESTIM